MQAQDYTKRKHLTIFTKNDKPYFRVQINKNKLGLRVDKTFSHYEQATEFLEACLNKISQKSVKTLLDIESREIQFIQSYLSEPPLAEYKKIYIKRYIEPKYKEYEDDKQQKNRLKLRQRDSFLSKLKIIMSTKFKHTIPNDWTLSKAIYKPKEEKTLAELKPKDVTIDDVNELVLVFKNQNLKPSTISDYISKMSVFWKKLGHIDEDLKPLVNQNPFLMFDKELISNGTKRFKKRTFRFTKEKLRQLVGVIRNNGNPEFRAIIHLMVKLGLRRSEAVLLEKSQFIETPVPHLYIQSKNTERIVYLNKGVMRFIKPFIKENEERLFKYKLLGFSGSFDKPLNKFGINQHSLRKHYVSTQVDLIGLNNSILLAQVLGLSTPRSIEKLKNTIAEPQNQILNQNDLLNRIGHSNSRQTFEHYYSPQEMVK